MNVRTQKILAALAAALALVAIGTVILLHHMSKEQPKELPILSYKRSEHALIIDSDVQNLNFVDSIVQNLIASLSDEYSALLKNYVKSRSDITTSVAQFAPAIVIISQHFLTKKEHLAALQHNRGLFKSFHLDESGHNVFEMLMRTLSVGRLTHGLSYEFGPIIIYLGPATYTNTKCDQRLDALASDFFTHMILVHELGHALSFLRTAMDNGVRQYQVLQELNLSYQVSRFRLNYLAVSVDEWFAMLFTLLVGTTDDYKYSDDGMYISKQAVLLEERAFVEAVVRMFKPGGIEEFGSKWCTLVTPDCKRMLPFCNKRPQRRVCQQQDAFAPDYVCCPYKTRTGNTYKYTTIQCLGDETCTEGQCSTCDKYVYKDEDCPKDKDWVVFDGSEVSDKSYCQRQCIDKSPLFMHGGWRNGIVPPLPHSDGPLWFNFFRVHNLTSNNKAVKFNRFVDTFHNV